MKNYAKKLLAMVLCMAMMLSNISTDFVRAFADEDVPVSSEDTATPTSLGKSISDYADTLYLDNSSMIGLSTSRVYGEGETADSPIYAGTTIKYRINYVVKTADYWGMDDSWQTGYDQSMKLFDTYTNNSISVTLPAGLLLVGVDSQYRDGMSVSENSENGSHTYTFFLEDMDAEANNDYVEIAVFITGNGTDHALKTFNMANCVTFSTQFTALNKSCVPYETLNTYKQVTTASIDSFSTSTPDEWGITKSVVENSVSVDRSNMIAYVDYKIGIGLLVDGQVETSLSAYASPGRDALSSMYLTDDQIQAVVNGVNGINSGTSLTATKISIVKSGVEGATPVDPTDSKYEDGISLTTGAFALNTVHVEEKVFDQSATNPYKYIEDEEIIYNEVPVYTEYIVHAEYELDDEKMIQHFENPQGQIEFTNVAELDYQLAGVDAVDPLYASATTYAGLPVMEPANVLITKYLKTYLGEVSEYGLLTYTISTTDGAKFKVYDKTADGKYNPRTGEVTLWKEAVAGVTYYLTPGLTYQVTENYTGNAMVLDQEASHDLTSPNPIAEGYSWRPVFQNMEEAADIHIEKKDDLGLALEGAKFTLYDEYTDENNNHVYNNYNAVATNEHGHLTFTKVPYGTYYLKEVEAPEGFAATSGEVITIKIDHNVDSDSRDYTYSFVNQRNVASIRLTKYVGVDPASTHVPHPENNADQYGTFKLQRSTDKQNWSYVTIDAFNGTISTTINNTGNILAFLDAFDSKGNAYWYRFEETIPANSPYYNLSYPTASTVYSEPVKLTTTTTNDAGETVEVTNNTTVDVTMTNLQRVSISVTKLFYDMKSDGTLSRNTENKTVQVTLYKKVGNSFVQVGDPTSAGSNTPAQWDRLPAYEIDSNGNNSRISYYVAESSVNGYSLDLSQATGAEIVNGVTYVPVSFNNNATTASKTLYNIEQVVPVIIQKQNYYTGSFVDGTGFTITTSDGQTVYDLKNKDNDNKPLELTRIPISTETGVIVYLAPGTTYNLTESVNTSGMKYVSGAGEFTTNSASTYNSSNANLQVLVLKNAPDPEIEIIKLSARDHKVKPTGAVYTVYRKVQNDDGTTSFVPVLGNNNQPVTITTNMEHTGVRLAPGDYYLAETTIPEGYIDPNKVPTEYTSRYNNYETGTTSPTTVTIGTGDKATSYNTTNLTFAKITVADTNNNVFSATFYNIPNNGALKVIKKVDGSQTSIPGFPVVVTGNDGTSKSKKTGNDGTVTITNLPIYNANGEKIIYTITEDTLSTDNAGSLGNKYYKVSDGQTATLSVGTMNANGVISVVTTSKDNTDAHATLVIENESYTSLEVSKYYVHSWESEFISMRYPMSDVNLGLYALDTKTNTYTLVGNPKLTEHGLVSFDHLRRDTTYAVVEISSPNVNFAPYDDGEFKKFAVDAEGQPLQSIPAGQLGEYNARTLLAEGTTIPATDENSEPTTVVRQSNTVLDPMENRDHWVQFEIKKFIDDQPLSETHTHKTSIHDNDKPYDNAVFNLYRMKVLGDVTTVTFDVDHPVGEDSGWELMGTYISGTAYDITGERIQGEFLTNVDNAASSDVVYMLVETNAGPNGGIINPYFQYTFWQYDNDEPTYSVEVVGTDQTIRQKTYKLDQINEDQLLNSKPQPGQGGSILISAIRIAKWADSFGEDGLPEGNYVPLPGAEFKIFLDAEGLPELETLTVGLDNIVEDKSEDSSDSSTEDAPEFAVRAWAQGTAYALAIEDGVNSTTGILTDYAKQDENGNPVSFNVEVKPLNTANGEYTIFGVPVYIQEINAPEGYTYESEMYPMYLCFVYYNGTSGVAANTAFNDAYFVTSATGNYPLISSQYNRAAVLTWREGNNAVSRSYGAPMYRIVDYPMEETLVRIQKYGYTPQTSTLGKTSEELDDLLTTSNRIALDGITMKIQKLDGTTWKDWNYRANDFATNQDQPQFVTGANGDYLFANGLSVGTYRIIELDLGNHNTYYENAYSIDTCGRVFQVVDKHAMTVTMYNPSKTSLTITKKDTAESPATIANVSFTLTNVSTKEATTVTTNANGQAVFSNLPSGYYKLTEGTDANAAGLSNAYLSQFAAYVANAEGHTTNDTILNDLINKPNGAFIGYELSASSDSKDRVVSSANLEHAAVALTVVDPSLASFTIKKVSEADSNQTLNGAQFTVYFMAFDKWQGNMQVTPYTPNSTAWTLKGDGTYTTDDNGLISLTNLTPGVYAFFETKAPDGFEIIDSKIHYLVLTGGMDVTVTIAPEAEEGEQEESEQGEESQAITPDTLVNGQVVIENRPLVNIKATKTVTWGDWGEQVEAKDLPDRSFTLQLYDASGSQIGLATVSKTSGAVFFTSNGKNVLLRQGQTYYLSENTADGYTIGGMKIGETPLTFANSKYSFVVPYNSENVQIDVTNIYMHGYVTFKKVDSEDFQNLLPGASFKVVTLEDGKYVDVSGCEVAEIEKDSGIYQANILLKSTTETTYYIVETNAPNGYILDTGIKLPVTLSAEHNYVDWSNASEVQVETETEKKHYLENVRGWHLYIQKYADQFSAANPVPAGIDDAAFSLFHKKGDQWELVYQNTETDLYGKVEYLLIPGETYAFTESGFDHNKFVGLETWATDVTNEGVTSRVQVPTTLIEYGEHTYDAIVLENVGQNFSYYAYNIPLVSVRIVKRDVGNYPVDVTPTAGFAIYELSDPLPTDKQQAEALISSLIATGNPLSGDDIPTVTTVPEGHTTYAMWNYCDPTKNYVVVETHVGSMSQDEYDTLNKDDKRVVWYQILPAVPAIYPMETRVVYLDNVYGEAEVTITKSVVEKTEANTTDSDTDNTAVSVVVANDVVGGKVDSLLEGDRHVVYTLTPNVTTHNQPLTSFVVSDSGLTFKAGNEALAGEYEITSITVGKASHTKLFGSDISAATISALVTWKDKYDNTFESTIEDISTSEVTINMPGAVSFEISYYCSDIKTKEEHSALNVKSESGESVVYTYVLGSDFTVDPITVNVLVKQQADGNVTNPVKPITEFTNHSSVTMTYPKWAADGSGVTMVTKDDTADAKVTVNSIPYPVVSIYKTSDPHDVVAVASEITYTFTIKNDSDVEFKDPVILDMLPSGITFTGEYQVGKGKEGESFTATVKSYNGRPTLHYSTGTGSFAEGDSETAVVISLKGTLQPHSEVKVSIVANVNNSAVIYGDKAYNGVFLSSDASTYHTVGNEHGYSFRLSDGSLPRGLSDEATHLNGTARLDELLDKDVFGTRLTGLDRELGNYAEDYYVWVSSFSEVDVVAKGSITLEKSIQGDQDEGFSSQDNFLATATRTNFDPEETAPHENGWVNYRLTVSNGRNEDKKFVVIGDVLPAVHDGRSSHWNVELESINSVVYNGNKLIEGTNYFVYYYYGDVSSARQEIEDISKRANAWGANQAWPQLGNNPRTNWYLSTSTEKPTSRIVAFAIVFAEEFELRIGKTIVVTYHTKVENITDDDYFAQHVAFTNCVNNFYVNWAGSFNGDPMISNQVSAVIMDGPVSVGGDVWIDEDMDGTQQNAGNRRTYLSDDPYETYEIIKALVENIKFSIVDNRKIASGVKEDQHGTNAAWNISESIKHFQFTGLGAALQVRDPLYYGEQLNTSALKTTDPYNYSLVAEIKDKTLLDIFKLTSLGSGHYMSDDPDARTNVESADYAVVNANFLDSNFFETEPGVYVTNPFYLRYSIIEDISKDIGFTMTRGLEITKVKKDGEVDVPMEGVEFTISGPFDENEANANGSNLTFKLIDGIYMLDPNGTVTTLVTDASGKIKIDGLNWWKEYVITEIKNEVTADFSLANAKAAGNEDKGTRVESLTGVNGAWVLQIPATNKVEKFDLVTITNVEPYAVDEQIYVHKDINDYGQGMYPTESKTFEFTLAPKGNAPMPSDAVKNDNGTSTKTISITTQDGTMLVDEDEGPVPAIGSFGAITFTKAGTYTYSVTEKVVAENSEEYKRDYLGIKFDDHTYAVAITVAEGNGTNGGEAGSLVITNVSVDNTTVKANGLYVEGYSYSDIVVKVTNAYSPLPTTVELPVNKVIFDESNPLPQNMTFTFKLLANGNAPVPASDGEVASVTIEKGKKTAEPVNFGTITFDKVGTYVYEVIEDPTNPYYGVRYSEEHHYYTVVVTDIGGQLEAKVYLDIVGEITEETKVGGTAVFTNIYHPDPTTVVLPVEKWMSETSNPLPVEKTFFFKLEAKTEEADDTENSEDAADTGAPDEGDEDESDVAPLSDEDLIPELTQPMPAEGEDETFIVIPAGMTNGTSEFGEITYKEAGTYYYVVYEVEGTYRGVGYDKVAHIYKVVVTDNYGKLSAKVFLDEDTEAMNTAEESVVFENSYKPDEVTITLPVEKLMSGNPIPEDMTFEFVLEAKISTADEEPENSEESETEDSEESETENSELTEDNNESSDSEDTEATDVNNSSNAGDDNSASNDENSEDSSNNGDNSGTTPDQEDDADEDEEPAEVQPMPAEGEDHAIVVVAAGETNGTASFGEITYTKAGTYSYTVSEVEGTYHGVGYDKATHTYKVVVTDMDGYLSAEIFLDDAEESINTTEEIASFTNTYEPDAVMLSIPVEKVIKGNDTPEDKAFTFVLKGASEDVPMPEEGKESVVVMGNGQSAFGTITYKFADVYEYTVSEVKGDETGYTYDETVYAVTVTVVDTEGVLGLSVEYAVVVDSEDETNESAEKIVFTNNYKPNTVEVVIPVEKNIDGDTHGNEEKTFSFTLSAVTKDAPMPEEATVEIVGEDTADFGAITFEVAGEYEYTLVEIDTEETGYIYDSSVRTILIKVTDNDGNLEAEWTVNDKEAESVVFVNQYEAKPVEVVLKATKILKNLNLKDGMFDFTLSDATGKVLEVVTNKENGDITFSPLTFTEVGVYTYTIRELPGNMPNTTYDPAVYSMTVTVTDNDGVLEATVFGFRKPEFVNEYKPVLPATGYGPDHNGLLYALALAAVCMLIATRKKKTVRKTK